ncbi:glycosyltransferase family 2 protein [Arthrobacter gengyunqii]|uniref:Glycosyltransferase n=1 Tax=Arthrobacter gengyunqii TaxID=2886940 RepID=A0ABS8GJE5_9MICC|nr:glycosyltransferase family 2 protein [Arthrobacter gengyunqii]MCC3266571.1 glycosyltransferase [Arthrobacter gengyunqii]
MPLISIIMPSYNAETTISRAIKSTLLALPADGELVIVDDGSRDSSLEIAQVAQSKDSRVRIIERPINGGIVAALNDGIVRSDSEFVGRMDADDISLPWRLRYTLKALIHHRIDIAFTTVASIGPGRSVRPAIPVGITPEAMGLNLLLVNPVAHSTMVATRKCLTALDGYRSVPSEDYDLWLRAASKGFRLARLPLPSQLYRLHADQITASAAWKEQASVNAKTAAAHQVLCEVLLGETICAFTELRTGQINSPEVGALLNAVTRAGRTLPELEKLALNRQLRKVTKQSHRV